MTELFNYQCYTSPTMYWKIQYEHKRSGADMLYRFYWKVWLGYQDGWYYDGLRLQMFLDGVEHDVTVKGYQPNVYGWSYDGTTDWYKVSNKTSGATSFFVRLYDTSTATVKVTSGTYWLTVSGAGSALGAIPSFDVDVGVTIPITKYDGTFTDTLVVSYGGTVVKTVSGITNGTKLTFTDKLTTIYGLMSKVNSGTFTFALTTKSGSTTVGTSTKTATGSIYNANPTFTASQVAYADTNSKVYNITGNPQHIVQNKSSLRVTFGNATGNKGATISKYAITVNGVTKTATASGYIDFGAVNTSQNTKISATVTDSRGNTTTVTKDVTILAYSTPTFSVVLERLNNYEDETYITVQANISSVNSKNSVTISYKNKQSGGSYGTATALTNNTKHTLSCNKDYSYVFAVTVADKFESVTVEYVLPKGKFPLFIDTERNAVGINEFPSNGEALRVAGGVGCFEEGIVLKSASFSWLLTVTDSGSISITKM